MVLRDADGNEVQRGADAGIAFGYDLPDLTGSVSHILAKKVRVTFGREVPALGYRTYYLETTRTAQNVDVFPVTRMCENDAMRFIVNEDGSYSLLDKRTGDVLRTWFYEDTGDMGNEYIYIQDTGKQVISTKDERPRVSCVERNAFRTVVEIRHKMMVPSGMGEELQRQRRMCIDPYTRAGKPLF